MFTLVHKIEDSQLRKIFIKRWMLLNQATDHDIYNQNLQDFIYQVDKFKYALPSDISIDLSRILLKLLDNIDVRDDPHNILDCVSDLLIEASYKPKTVCFSMGNSDVLSKSVIISTSSSKQLTEVQLKELTNPMIVKKLSSEEKDQTIIQLVQLIGSLQHKVVDQQKQIDNLWDEIDGQ
ncbi:hypothetical protein SS50377_23472 [Spironucleus salmonicida]|nr:hypothetical protein SS50377_23472 [Spironucleus salmonicida]